MIQHNILNTKFNIEYFEYTHLYKPLCCDELCELCVLELL